MLLDCEKEEEEENLDYRSSYFTYLIKYGETYR